MNKMYTKWIVGGLVAVGGIATSSSAGQWDWAVAVSSSSGGYRGGERHGSYVGRESCAPRYYDHSRSSYGRAGSYVGHNQRVFSGPSICAPVHHPPVMRCVERPVVRYVEPRVVYVQPAPVVQQVVYVPPVETAWVQNSNGSRTPVQLRRADGGMFVGPRGEYYLGWPNEDQLRRAYGM